MFKKMIAVLALSIAISLPALSDDSLEVFYSSVAEVWSTTGVRQTGGNGALCMLSSENGKPKEVDFVTVWQDLNTGEMSLHITHHKWNITGRNDKPYSAKIAFEGRKGKYVFDDAVFFVVENNRISFPDLHKENFLNAFVYYRTMTIEMPGTVPDIEISLSGTGNAVGNLSACLIEASKAGIKLGVPADQSLGDPL